MAEAEKSTFLAQTRYAVVTGANKGIGLELCKQLASHGVVVVLTARNEKRGLEAIDKLTKSGINPHNLEFHQLDVTNPSSISSLVDFICAKFGKLDILVNNAAILGANVDFVGLKAVGVFITPGVEVNYSDFVTHTYEQATECLNTNYYGVQRTIEALLPLLQISDSPRIINVSSYIGKLGTIPNEGVREILNNIENLTKEKIDEVVNEFLKDYKDESLVEKGWDTILPAYTVSKAVLNSYSRILARKYPSIIINCFCPGYTKTDMNNNTGIIYVEESGSYCVKLALMPHGSASGLFFEKNQVSSFCGNTL